ncbi:hypothetical protein [Allosphingosinicella deserti]|uniref:hypothetical protein n=1 Tax=Allosphingosinicella deserti TaxID=2116704 RepID=UPI0011B224A8|nr:hypothetical protein [Sphingomonas deserti]
MAVRAIPKEKTPAEAGVRLSYPVAALSQNPFPETAGWLDLLAHWHAPYLHGVATVANAADNVNYHDYG